MMKKNDTTIEQVTSKISIWSAGLQPPVDKGDEHVSLQKYEEILNILGRNVRFSKDQLVADMDGMPFNKVKLTHEVYRDITFTFIFEGESLRLPQISSIRIDTNGNEAAPSFSQVSGGLKYSLENAGFTTSAFLTGNGFFLEDMKITEIVVHVNPPFHWWK